MDTGISPVVGTATVDRRYAQPNGADWRQHGRRQARRGPRPRPRATHARCSQIKLTAGGGVSSPFSPMDVSSLTEPELRAAVEAAENWALTYRARVHTNGNTAGHCRRCEVYQHGFLMDNATAKLIAEKGIWLSLQALPEELRQGFPPGSVQRAKADEVWPGIARPTSWRKNTRSRPRGAAMSCSPKHWHSSRGQFLPRLSAGTVPPKRSPRRPGLTRTTCIVRQA